MYTVKHLPRVLCVRRVMSPLKTSTAPHGNWRYCCGLHALNKGAIKRRKKWTQNKQKGSGSFHLGNLDTNYHYKKLKIEYYSIML